MRTATLLAFVGTWLGSLAGIVRFEPEYLCGNDVHIPVSDVNNSLNLFQEQAINCQQGFNIGSPGYLYDGKPKNRASVSTAMHAFGFDFIDLNIDHWYEYIIVYDIDFKLQKFEAVRLRGSKERKVLKCEYDPRYQD
ncbi:putative candidate secreted effector protein [Blumeria hordei DH14]|uniref:Putative candidate secreted effector protein n=1 Tax=Blumeria graminis f. sp. hordei (strain DH14) TaxID=546991 RepID=N1J8E0_BLUG1|nr:putative candidate secreted effector protein [Blumeria hordei DH14]